MENISVNDSGNILTKNCRDEWVITVCYFANVCGLISTGIWFLVLLPQVIRSFRHRSVEGLSLGWAILNFTAALNNTFFVFKFPGGLPLYARISAVYMPILEAMLLVEFFIFTKYSKTKIILAVVLCIIWGALAAAQLIFEIYRIMEWVSITMWSIETFPQVILNSKRQSTYGLSNGMVTLSTIGKTTDFLSTYLLILPMQYVIMAYFSSSVAFISTLQVIWYWNQRPEVLENQTEDAIVRRDESPEKSGSSSEEETHLIRDPTSKTCHALRYLGLTAFSLELVGFAVGLVWRTDSFFTLFAPAGILIIVVLGWAWYHLSWVKNLKPKFVMRHGFI